MRNYAGIIIAILLALTVGFVILKFSGHKSDGADIVANPQKNTPVVQTVDILVAMKDIPIGTKLDETMFDKQPWPSNLVLDQFIEADKQANILGMVTRSPFQAREPLIMSKLANPNDPSFLAASLPRGMRAVTIATDGIQGVAGFVFPGDRVDILYTHEVPRSKDASRLATLNVAPRQAEKMTETLLPNLKVLAVDQRPSSTTGDKITPPVSVTLEVGTDDAQKLRLAEKNGTLSLTLRSLEDKDSTDVAGPTMVDNISNYRGESSGGNQHAILIVRGIKSEIVGVNAPRASDEEEKETPNAQHAQ